MKALLKAGIVGAVAVIGLTACSNGSPSSVNNDQKVSNTQLDRFQKNQPIPQSDWSQYRQTLIDVEMAQIHAVATTTFFFNLGTGTPIKMCPSIGFPVPTTSQLTNPQQLVRDGGSGTVVGGTVGQLEPNGAYTGDSTGTYVVCVSSNGTKYVTYWEGFVQTEGGPAHWDKAQQMIVLDGAPTVVAKTKK
jgi:hypothetical protein